MTTTIQFGSMMILNNTTAETTVDNTFRKIETFNTLGSINGVDCDLTDNEITVESDGTYLFIGDINFDGSNKSFEVALFKNDTNTGVSIEDKATGISGISTIFELVDGDVLDVRQRSATATSLTVNTLTLSLIKLK